MSKNIVHVIDYEDYDLEDVDYADYDSGSYKDDNVGLRKFKKYTDDSIKKKKQHRNRSSVRNYSNE